MIGFLSGIIHHLQPNQVIVNVSGVGYRVLIPSNLNLKLNQPIKLFIHTYSREDTLSLYGFSTSQQLELFETLISVSGIGPKIALILLSSSTAKSIKEAITASNVNFFTAIPGIGKKGAQRLIVELKSKLSQTDLDMGNLDQNSDLVDALNSLGFKINEIKKILPQINHQQPLESQIKQALKQLKP